MKKGKNKGFKKAAAKGELSPDQKLKAGIPGEATRESVEALFAAVAAVHSNVVKQLVDAGAPGTPLDTKILDEPVAKGQLTSDQKLQIGMPEKSSIKGRKSLDIAAKAGK
jgi:hypothetical protein